MEGIDLVIHTASFGMSGKDMLLKEKVRAINVGGTETLLKGCLIQGVVGLVYTSTANVVFTGKKEIAGVAEEDLPYNELHDCVDEYSRTKCIAEQLVIAANNNPLEKENPKVMEMMRTPKIESEEEPKHGEKEIPNSEKKSGSLSSSSGASRTWFGPAKTLKTCAIRPAGIYGEGEERHFPRIIKMLEKGLLKFKVGSPDTLVDWVHVDNLVWAHLLAAAKLLTSDAKNRSSSAEKDTSSSSDLSSSSSSFDSPRSIVGGNAYYISDQEPINQWEFLRPLIEGLGFPFPSIWIPFSVMFRFAHLVEIAHGLINPIFPFEPFVNRAEVCKVGVTHYFPTSKAERHLGWIPLLTARQGMDRMVAYFQEDQKARAIAEKERRKKAKDGNDPLLFLIIGVVLFAMLYQVYKRTYG